MRTDITPNAKLIASLAETMSNSDWASDILNRCALIREAVQKIEQEARSRSGSER